MPHEYTSPVSQIFQLPLCEAAQPEQWPNYVDELQLTGEQIPELLRLMRDVDLAEIDPDNPPLLPNYIDPETAWCAPIHAWRALYQLQALELFDAALEVIDSGIEEWAEEEFIDITLQLGPIAIPPVEKLLRENVTKEIRITALIEALFKLPKKYPEERDRVVKILHDCLESYADNSEDHNTFLVMGLLDLEATESANLLEKVYVDHQVDEFFTGTWAQAQVDLGLKRREDFTEEELTPEMPPGLQQMREMIDKLQRQNKPDAFSAGMPVNSRALPSTKPPDFDDLVRTQRLSSSGAAEKGFSISGKGQGSKKKKKKKKK